MKGISRNATYLCIILTVLLIIAPVAGCKEDPHQAEREALQAKINTLNGELRNATADLIGSVLGGGSGSAAGGIGNVTSILASAQDDMKTLIQLSGCKSPAVKRLEDKHGALCRE